MPFRRLLEVLVIVLQDYPKYSNSSLQREIPYEVSPFFRIHGGPNQEQLVYCCRDRQMLRNQEQPGTLTGRDKHREVSWHRLEIVCDENPTVLRRVG